MKYEFSEKLKALPPYLFSEIDRKKRQLVESGTDVVDLGIGDPDLPTPEPIVQALCDAAHDAATHRYASYTGSPELRRIIARWFEQRYHVKLDPDREILPLLGSKEGIGHLPTAFVNAGDEVLIPDPAYPVYRAGTIFAGGVPVVYPLRPENGFLPDLAEVKPSPRTRMIFVNYPNNPTGAVAGLDVLGKIADFARKHSLILCQDAAYAEIAFDGTEPASLMQTPVGREVGIEFHSLSKTFSMAGWRVGFAVGSPDILAGLGRVKTNLDSGIFEAVQRAAMCALTDCRTEQQQLLQQYDRRRHMLVNALRKAGWDVQPPVATLYIWMKVPDGGRSADFAEKLLTRLGIVVTPGIGFGEMGEGFIRMSLTAPDERIEEAARRFASLKNRVG